MFRFKRSIPVPYNQQGHIYFTSRRYQELPRQEQAKIRKLCDEAGGDYRDALFEFVTTDEGKAKVCSRHFVSESTLERAERRYYIAFYQSYKSARR